MSDKWPLATLDTLPEPGTDRRLWQLRYQWHNPNSLRRDHHGALVPAIDLRMEFAGGRDNPDLFELELRKAFFAILHELDLALEASAKGESAKADPR